MTNDQVKKIIEECRNQGMPAFMIHEHIMDLMIEEEEEELIK